MFKYYIRVDLFNGQSHSYYASNFIVVDNKLEIIIDKSVISYDFNLIKGLIIDNEEDE